MLKIGNLDIQYRAMLSPLASLTDIVFRRLVDEIGGVGYMVTEMISAEGIRRKQQHAWEKIAPFAFHTPQFIQLFGSQPDQFVDAVKFIENETGFAGVDINMGCPANKVVKKGAGSALLKNPPLAGRIVREIKRASRLPLTAKIRLGYDKVDVLPMARILDQEGVDALAVHFRLKTDGYRGQAQWEYAPAIREEIGCPLIGNGDIRTAEAALARLDQVDGVMIGRGAVIDPSIFARVAGLAADGPGHDWDMARILSRLLELIAEYYPEKLRLNRIKAFARFIFSGQVNGKYARQSIYGAATFDQARTCVAEILREAAAFSVPGRPGEERTCAKAV